MKVEEARKTAAKWVTQHASREAGFLGAYFSGSTVGLPGEADLPESSDIDLIVVTQTTEPPPKLGKFRYEQALLEVTYLPWSQLASADKVLSDYHLAGSFRTDTIIADPTGRLRRLQTEVAPRFAEKPWVLLRCKHAHDRIERGLRNLDPKAPLQNQVLGWLFPTGVTTHVLLTAALRNPTIRLRYLRAREVLEAYGHREVYSGQRAALFAPPHDRCPFHRGSQPRYPARLGLSLACRTFHIRTKPPITKRCAIGGYFI